MESPTFALKERTEDSTTYNTTILCGLERAVNHSLNQLDINYYKLLQIAKNYSQHVKGEHAVDGLAKIIKLKAIAFDLSVDIKCYAIKIKKSSSIVANKDIQTTYIEQLIIETELLNDMLFNVAKKYFSFINNNFEPKVISMQNIAA